jgi:L-lactate utilization protein LutB
MDKNIKFFIDKRIERTKAALIKNNYDVYVVDDAKGAREKIKELIEDNSVVSFGGSMTIIDTGIIDMLRKCNIKLLDRYKEGLTKDDIGKLYRESFFCRLLYFKL